MEKISPPEHNEALEKEKELFSFFIDGMGNYMREVAFAKNIPKKEKHGTLTLIYEVMILIKSHYPIYKFGGSLAGKFCGVMVTAKGIIDLDNRFENLRVDFENSGEVKT